MICGLIGSILKNNNTKEAVLLLHVAFRVTVGVIFFSVEKRELYSFYFHLLSLRVYEEGYKKENDVPMDYMKYGAYVKYPCAWFW